MLTLDSLRNGETCFHHPNTLELHQKGIQAPSSVERLELDERTHCLGPTGLMVAFDISAGGEATWFS